MEVNQNSKPLPDLRVIREKFIEENRSNFKDPQKLELEADVEMFTNALPEQITAELGTKFIKYEEYTLRKNKEKNFQTPQEYQDALNRWKEAADALKGAERNGPISSTIEYLNNKAIFFRSLSKMKASQGNSIQIDPLHFLEGRIRIFETVLSAQEGANEWERAAQNCETAAKLFKNYTQLKVKTEEEQ